MTVPRAARRREPPPRSASADALGVERRLRGLELTVVRRLDGMLQGQYRSTMLGPGSEPGEGRQYRFGDDVRRIDWKLTARAGALHVRDAIAEREAEMWFVVDRSTSMDFGSARHLKRELATGAVAALGFLGTRAGSRVGAVLFGAGPLRVHPAAAGRDAVRRVLVDLDGPDTGAAPDGSSLAEALFRVRRIARRRAVIVVVSDFLLDAGWEVPLRGLREGHDLIAVELVDPLELEIPAVGTFVVEDPESGARREIRTSPAVRAEYAALTAAHRASVAAALRAVTADHLVIRTDQDWVREVAGFLKRRRLTAWLTVGAARLAAR